MEAAIIRSVPVRCSQAGPKVIPVFVSSCFTAIVVTRALVLLKASPNLVLYQDCNAASLLRFVDDEYVTFTLLG